MMKPLHRNYTPDRGKKTLEAILGPAHKRVPPVLDEFEELEEATSHTEGGNRKQDEEKAYSPPRKNPDIQVRHPLAVDSLQRLFYYLGYWVVMLFAIQAASVYMVAKLARDHFEFDKIAAFLVLLAFVFAVDVIAYLMLRGRIYPLFLKPGLHLLASTTIPGIAVGFLDFIYDLSWLHSSM